MPPGPAGDGAGHGLHGPLRRRQPGGAVSAANARLVQAYGPWAVVTGASDGIGRAFAQALAARGLQDRKSVV